MGKLNKTLVIVPCSKSKIWSKRTYPKKVPAKDAYISPYFRLCRLYAEKFSDKWLIFSGKYGIISPNIPIENYDDKLIYKKMNKEFCFKIKKQLEELLEEYNIVVSLCGGDYFRVIEEAIGDNKVKVYNPLSGLKIGERMKKLKECIENDGPLL